MVRGIDIQNVIANTQFVNREQQIAQQQANFAPAHAAQESQREEDVKKERIQQSRQTEQEHETIDPNRRQTLLRRRRERRRAGPPAPTPDRREKPERPRPTGDKGHLIDVEG